MHDQNFPYVLLLVHALFVLPTIHVQLMLSTTILSAFMKYTPSFDFSFSCDWHLFVSTNLQATERYLRDGWRFHFRVIKCFEFQFFIQFNDRVTAGDVRVLVIFVPTRLFTSIASFHRQQVRNNFRNVPSTYKSLQILSHPHFSLFQITRPLSYYVHLLQLCPTFFPNNY
jgi:hypothetical protein